MNERHMISLTGKTFQMLLKAKERLSKDKENELNNHDISLDKVIAELLKVFEEKK
jgi:hypothetical protein